MHCQEKQIHREEYCLKNNELKDKVSADQYDHVWIKNTWGWDTPEEFIRSQGRNLRPRIRYALKIANLSPGMNVLDVGCGRGEVVLFCARNGIHALGVDYSKEAISIAQKAKATHSPEQQKQMEFICNDIEKIKFNESFDRIFMLDLIEHLHDWELSKLFRVCGELLKPDGYLVIHSLPNRWVYEITYRRILRLFMPWLPANPRTEKEMSIHINEMTITHLANIVTQAGFGSRIWLKDLIVEQAHWHKGQKRGDLLGRAYALFSNPIIGTFYKILAKTPLKLLIVNEMFALAWQEKQNPETNAPRAFTERLTIKLINRFD
jgi:2-polyprenyl-3-methyl-5-hydroxy-6-metoxy-1,4-benzoquinol methylase